MNIYFLHGFGGSASDWDEVRKFLPGVPLTIDWGAVSCLDDVIALLAEQASEGRADFVGYSMGGRLSILLAKALTERLRPPNSLVLLSSGLGFASISDRETRRAKDLEWARLAHSDLAHFWKEWYSQELFSSLKSLPGQRLENWMKARMSIDSSTLSRSLEIGSPANHEHLLETLKLLAAAGVKILYIAGELDKKYNNLAKELALTGVPTALIPNAGHALPLECPREIARITAEFLH